MRVYAPSFLATAAAATWMLFALSCGVEGFTPRLERPALVTKTSLVVSVTNENCLEVLDWNDDRRGQRRKRNQEPRRPIRRRGASTTVAESQPNPLSQKTEQSTFPECMVLSWECDVEAQIREELMQRNNRPLQKTNPEVSQQPYIVGVVGIPGSGKSTSCSVLTQSLADQGSLLMPVDGYHYSVEHLLGLENADDALYRRGAPDTFDVHSLRQALERIRFGEDPHVKIPGFDHARGDPELDAYTFDRSQHKVIIVEGLYLLHDDHGWESIKDYLDTSVFVDACVDTCVDRLKIRNQCIPGYNREEIELRCDVVDRANAMTVDQSRQHAHWVVQGIASKRKN